MSMSRRCLFIKLGGSLITDKRQAETPRLDVIRRLALELAEARRRYPSVELVLGHGSGSFGHVVGRKYGTRAGVSDETGWFGFSATADAAARLNRIVVAELLAAGLPAWTIQPSVDLRLSDGAIQHGPEETVALALQRSLLPVVHGDVALDSVRGGTIVSTEEIFQWLAPRLQPTQMLLVGEVDGIFTADPLVDPEARRIPRLTGSMFADIRAGLGESFGIDVTGGMVAKVSQALTMVEENFGLEVIIAGGLEAGSLTQLLDRLLGTPSENGGTPALEKATLVTG